MTTTSGGLPDDDPHQTDNMVAVVNRRGGTPHSVWLTTLLAIISAFLSVYVYIILYIYILYNFLLTHIYIIYITYM